MMSATLSLFDNATEVAQALLTGADALRYIWRTNVLVARDDDLGRQRGDGVQARNAYCTARIVRLRRHHVDAVVHDIAPTTAAAEGTCRTVEHSVSPSTDTARRT